MNGSRISPAQLTRREHIDAQGKAANGIHLLDETDKIARNIEAMATPIDAPPDRCPGSEGGPAGRNAEDPARCARRALRVAARASGASTATGEFIQQSNITKRSTVQSRSLPGRSPGLEGEKHHRAIERTLQSLARDGAFRRAVRAQGAEDDDKGLAQTPSPT